MSDKPKHDAYESQIGGKDAYESALPEPPVTVASPTPALFPKQVPTMGRIVHYVLDDAETIRPAIIVHVNPPIKAPDPEEINLLVFVNGEFDRAARGQHADATPTDFRVKVPHVEVNADGEYPARSWHWPAR